MSASSAARVESTSPTFDIAAAVKANAEVASGAKDMVWLTPFASSEGTGNEMIFFVKPEVASEKGVDMTACLNVVDAAFRQHNVSVDAIGVLGAPCLKAHNIIGGHYGVINQISRLGRKALVGDTAKKFEADFAAELQAGAKVLGGHEILESYPFMSAESLGVLVDALFPSSKKIAPGTYGLAFNMFAEKVIALNGFHPYQLLNFYNPGRSMIVMLVRTNTSWADMRDKLVGATNPLKAEAGSIRQTFLARQKELGIPVVSQANNGVHLSAGPIEAMFEIIRFCSDYKTGKMIAADQTRMGRLLKAAGVAEDKIQALGANPLLKTADKVISTFDLTEMQEPQQAVDALKTHVGQL